MTREDLKNRIAASTGVYATVVDEILIEAMEEIRGEVNRGGYVSLQGFGTFYLHHTPEKIGRDIHRGVPVIIPARSKPDFRVSRQWKGESNH